MKFSIAANCGRARAGILDVGGHSIPTPVFMPIGTRGSVKTVSNAELEALGAKLILGNAYHLYLRPGQELIGRLGGLHEFTGWRGAYLTDSGGYQVFSLKTLNDVDDGGVSFQSHIDGSRHRFTPAGVIDIQVALGAEIIMPLDVCSPFPVDERTSDSDMRRTVRWAGESFRHFDSRGSQGQTLFAIVQGSIYVDQRLQCLEEVLKLEPPGLSIGGLSVGEPKEERTRVLKNIMLHFPDELPRYLMGVGTPEDIIEAVALGADMFDCVMPTRNARNGTLFTRFGRMIIKAARYADDSRPIDSECSCQACGGYARAYIRHLLSVGEILGFRLATLHNLHFYLDMMRQIRESISESRFESFSRRFLENLSLGVEQLT